MPLNLYVSSVSHVTEVKSKSSKAFQFHGQIPELPIPDEKCLDAAARERERGFAVISGVLHMAYGIWVVRNQSSQRVGTVAEPCCHLLMENCTFPCKMEDNKKGKYNDNKE